MPAEIARLRTEELSGMHEIIMRAHELLADLELNYVEFLAADIRFRNLVARTLEMLKDEIGNEILAELRLLHVYYAERAGATAIRDEVLEHFFDDLDPESFFAIAQFLIVGGLCAYLDGQVRYALGYFVAVWTLVQPSDRLCLREVAARYVAKMYEELGRHDDARQVLAEADLLVDDTIEELLVVPVI